MFHRLRPRMNATAVNLCTATYLMLCANTPFWTATAAKLNPHAPGNWIFLTALGFTLAALFNIALSLVSFRHIHKPVAIAIIVAAALAGYFMSNYGVIIDRQMIVNVFETDRREASELLTWPLARHLALVGIVPSLLLARTEITYRPFRKELLLRLSVVLISFLLLGGTVLANYKKLAIFGRTNRELRMYINPSYPIYSVARALQTEEAAQKKELRKVALDAQRPPEEVRKVVVLVVGETARAENFSLNGYRRETNPELSRREIVNFREVQSCGTETAVSLPCMFSPFGKEGFSRSKASGSENLLDVLQRTGVKILWRNNNSGSKGVADRVEYQDLSSAGDEALCREGECYDEILLSDLAKAIREEKGDMLVVLHQKGSHGPSYYKRTPDSFKKFTPECTVDNIQDCAPQEIVNAYDNTIVYTDHFLARVIDLLAAQTGSSAMLYLSDHGESLGEGNLYLHGLPAAIAPREQHHVPMVFWASPAFLQREGVSLEQLRQRQSDELSHDNLFHTMLGIFKVSTKAYRPDLDILRSSRGAARQLPKRLPRVASR